MITAIAMVAGLALLAFASDWFVVGTARVATTLDVSPVVVGAVVIGFGTSAPELLVTLLASTSGEAALAVGNVVGSNLANLTLVLGAAALLTPVYVNSRTLRREAPISTAAVCLFAVALLAGLSAPIGAFLLLVLVGALVFIVRTAMASDREDEVELAGEVLEFEAGATPSAWREGGRAAVGLAGTLLGAQLVVGSAVSVATALGLSEGFVGLTIVAIGTSLPELVTAVQAARRGEDDLIVGNALGSNLFNSLAAGGLIGVASGGVDFEGPMRWSVLVMVATALLVGGVMAWRRSLRRPEAVVLLVAYGAFIPFLAGG